MTNATLADQLVGAPCSALDRDEAGRRQPRAAMKKCKPFVASCGSWLLLRKRGTVNCPQQRDLLKELCQRVTLFVAAATHGSRPASTRSHQAWDVSTGRSPDGSGGAQTPVEVSLTRPGTRKKDTVYAPHDPTHLDRRGNRRV